MISSDGRASMEVSHSKVHQVRSFFEEPRNYLAGREVQVGLRAETVRELTQGFEFHSVLDVGCGDGSISVPLLTEHTRLTLLDLATSMTALARSKVPATLAGNVECLNDDFMAADLRPQSYDLIICLGVLAHMDSPTAFLAKVATLLKPGGRVILEFTDSKHISGRTLRAYHRLCALRRPRSWTLNALSIKLVSRMLAGQHLRIESAFRYSLPPFPLIKKKIPPETLSKMVRRVFGNANSNRNAWLGSEYICLVSQDMLEGA